MEGSSEALKKQNCRGGRSCRPLAILLRNAFIISFAVSSGAFSQTFDVLIVEKPDHLVVYDAFQQSLTSLHETPLQPFAPIRILILRDVLNDGITTCSKVDVDGEIFYLLRDERGQLAGSKNLGILRVFQHVRSIDDTIEVIGSRQIAIQDPFGQMRRFLSAGEHCVRFFEFAGGIYAKRLRSQAEYGWLRLPLAGKGRSWRVVSPELARVDLSPMIRDRVIEKIKDVNLAYSEVYSLLGKESIKKFPVPQWQIESTNTSMTCVLRPAAAASFYRQSIQILSATLQTYLLGTGYEALVQRNAIEIKKR